jgi:hydrogenase nickel incorporation protein HypA/HybF
MHELSIAQNIIEIVQDNLSQSQKDLVKIVRVKVGKLTNILVDSLTFSFEALTKDTNLAGAVLEVEQLPLTTKCQDCGHQDSQEDFIFQCSACLSTDIKIISGSELMVSEIELKDEDGEKQ